MADDPRFADTVLGDGLALVPFTVIPHTDSVQFRDAIEKLRGVCAANGSPTIELTDSQAAVITNGSITLTEA